MRVFLDLKYNTPLHASFLFFLVKEGGERAEMCTLSRSFFSLFHVLLVKIIEK